MTGPTPERPEKLVVDAGVSAHLTGDVEIGVSLVGLIAQLQASIAAGFSEMRLSLAHKADKADVEKLRSDMALSAERIGELEQWRHDGVVQAASHLAHTDQARIVRRTVWQAVAAVWTAATTVALILASAGVWHP